MRVYDEKVPSRRGKKIRFGDSSPANGPQKRRKNIRKCSRKQKFTRKKKFYFLLELFGIEKREKKKDSSQLSGRN